MKGRPPASDVEPLAPVRWIPGDAERSPEQGIALCLSGGGSRAMLFHVGALMRLNEFGLLPKLARVSSVSGGSITAGMLAVQWSGLSFEASGRATSSCMTGREPLRRRRRRRQSRRGPS